MATRNILSLYVGERTEITLAENSSAGYLWDIEHVVQTGLASVQDSSDDAEITCNSEQSAGYAPLSRKVILRGEREGKFRITHSRPWLKSGDDDVLDVVVSARKGGPLLRDFWRGRPFSLNGHRMQCLDIADGFLVALDNDSHAHGRDAIRMVHQFELTHAYLLPCQLSENIGIGEDGRVATGSLWKKADGSLYVIVCESLREMGTACVTYREVATGDTWTGDRQDFLHGSLDSPPFIRLA